MRDARVAQGFSPACRYRPASPARRARCGVWRTLRRYWVIWPSHAVELARTPKTRINPGTVLVLEFGVMPPAPTVLVAEDQPLLRWAIGRSLEMIGAEVVAASTYEEACDRLSSQLFAAVVVASPLDGRSVVGMLSEVDRQQPYTRVLVLCAGDECDGILRDVPHATLFRKPLALSELMAAVAPAIGLTAPPAVPRVGALTLPVTAREAASGPGEPRTGDVPRPGWVGHASVRQETLPSAHHPEELNPAVVPVGDEDLVLVVDAHLRRVIERAFAPPRRKLPRQERPVPADADDAAAARPRR